MTIYRKPSERAASQRGLPRFGLDVGTAVVALACAAAEVTVQVLHGGAWEALPTIALVVGGAAVLAILREIARRRREARNLLSGAPGASPEGERHG